MELRNPMGEIGFWEVHNGLCLDTWKANVSPTLHFRVPSSRKLRLDLDVWKCFQNKLLYSLPHTYVLLTLQKKKCVELAQCGLSCLFFVLCRGSAGVGFRVATIFLIISRDAVLMTFLILPRDEVLATFLVLSRDEVLKIFQI